MGILSSHFLRSEIFKIRWMGYSDSSRKKEPISLSSFLSFSREIKKEKEFLMVL